MYLHLNDHIYVAFFRKEAIVLDLIKNKYFSMIGDAPTLLDCVLNYELFKSDTGYSVVNMTVTKTSQKKISKFIHHLFDSGILNNTKQRIPFPYYIDNKNSSAGVENLDWQLPISGVSRKLKRLNVFRTFLTLVQVHCLVKLIGFYPLIKSIKRHHRKFSAYAKPSTSELKNLVDCLNKACLFYPVKTKCLEWSATLVLLALKRGWQCNLVIGVQNYPFAAHSWVECDGKVVADRKDLPEDMAVILSEPFRQKI